MKCAIRQVRTCATQGHPFRTKMTSQATSDQCHGSNSRCSSFSTTNTKNTSDKRCLQKHFIMVLVLPFLSFICALSFFAFPDWDFFPCGQSSFRPRPRGDAMMGNFFGKTQSENKCIYIYIIIILYHHLKPPRTSGIR